MLQALLSGVASIQAQQTRMDVIGNNLANVNTTAYKSTQVTFQDLISQTIKGATSPNNQTGGTNPIQYGLGVKVGATSTDNSQGSLNSTGQPSDLAIQGNGYFLVSNSNATSYTRDGSFSLDAEGNLVQSSTGNHLLGWTADSYGNIDATQPLTAASTLKIPLGTLNAVQVTNQVSWAGNLNAAAINTDSWTSQVAVYDSLGGQHTVTIQFSNHQTPPGGVPPAGATSSWSWAAFEGGVTGTPIGNSASPGNSLVYFDANGNPVDSLPASTFNSATVPALNGAPAFKVNLDFTQLSQLNAVSSVSAKDQNGFPPGSLQGYSIGQDGTLTGLFTNGLTRALGQVAMANFPNPGGLSNIGDNLYQNTNNSGIPIVGQANTSGLGTISSGYLEQSNIDISNEFTDLIVTQRGFQANTKIISTVDTMLQDLINIIQ